MITDPFLVEKGVTLEVVKKSNKEVRLINLLNLGCQNSIRFNIFQVA